MRLARDSVPAYPSRTEVVWKLTIRALAIALAVFLSGGWAFAGPLIQCRMSGRVQPRCCCGKSEEATPRSGAPEVDRGSCCAAEHVEAEFAAATDTAPIALEHGDAAAVELLEVVPTLSSVRSVNVVPPRSRAPPPGWPPLFLKHCSLLH
jgi:hypothetical protein